MPLSIQSREDRTPTTGSRVRIRNSTWKVLQVEPDGGSNHIHCEGLSGIVKGKRSIFIDKLEEKFGQGCRVLDPADLNIVQDRSSRFTNTRLYLEAAFRNTPPPASVKEPMVLGKAAIHDFAFQHEPVKMALKQPRVRLLIADDVGLGKTLEAGLIASELILRHRADRILVVTTRAMLTQFQQEFWSRFAIPLARLDSSAIKRMRNSIPANYNVFEQFDRVIISVDTLKGNQAYSNALETCRWDLVIIDEAHNVAERSKTTYGSVSQRAELAQLLSNTADSLLLLTATPHDGRASSFSSLVNMLDPTRAPDPDKLRKPDINDLVIRRFRASDVVEADFSKQIKRRKIEEVQFNLTPKEDEVFKFAFEMRLDLDSGSERKSRKPKRAIDLFKTTLIKALLSSPKACLESVNGRIRRMGGGDASGASRDIEVLEELRDMLEHLEAADFGKYQNLLKVLREIGWTGKKADDRLVIFSERIATLDWLSGQLAKDLNLPSGAIAKVDGSRTVQADEKTQKVLEDFGQRRSGIRILLASDIASEGLNLHFQCHRLIHFDLPWSLLRFQQRNGRIDRYGQNHRPEIYYFLGNSAYKSVEAYRVLKKLIDKDKQVQKGIEDRAVFMRQGSFEGEEAETAEAIEGNESSAINDDENSLNILDDLNALFGPITPDADVGVSSFQRLKLFEDTFAFTAEMLASRENQIKDLRIKDDGNSRLIEFDLPDELKTNDAFGYRAKGTVDDRYMPSEVLGNTKRIRLTDKRDVITNAIELAKDEERSWPSLQYLWDVHPIVGWLGDLARSHFSYNEVPYCAVREGLDYGEVAVLVHGMILNRSGKVSTDFWSVVRFSDFDETDVNSPEAIVDRDVAGFLRSIGFSGDASNPGKEQDVPSKDLLYYAVQEFQTELINKRKAHQEELDKTGTEMETKLEGFRERYEEQYSSEDLEEIERYPNDSDMPKRLRNINNRKNRMDRDFKFWGDWMQSHLKLSDDPHPHVTVMGVFGRSDYGD